ncbi:MAG: sigma-70 family RNA polymerase sigma factor [bacterium]|nr:sigma-70 family RNA polymerase sigma factor [bacterium]
MENSDTDLDLVSRTLSGDQGAYRRLVERYRNAVYGLILSYVRDFDQAEDLAQEAFIRGYYRLHTLSDGDRFGGWLRTIAANLCRMKLRDRRMLPLSEDGLEAVTDPLPSPEAVREQEETQQEVWAALERLSRKEQEVVTLYYLEGERVAEVGKFLGISAEAVKARLYRARKTLQKEMVEMAKKTLSQKKLGRKFADQIEIREFSDLARLTDEELQALALETGMALARGLATGDEEAEVFKQRVLAVLPERDRENMEVHLTYSDPARDARRTVVKAAQDLQQSGVIRPAPRSFDKAPPKGPVEVVAFADLLRLTDREIQWVLREVDTKDLATALRGKGNRIRQVADRMQKNVSERVWRFIEIEWEHYKVSAKAIRAAQEGIVRVVWSLQGSGVIRPSKIGPELGERVVVRSFEDWAKLYDREIQYALREIDSRDLAVALMGNGKRMGAVKTRVMRNLSERVGRMIREAQSQFSPGKEDIEACQQKSLETIKQLQVLGMIRPPARKPTHSQYERMMTAAAQKRIERGLHGGRWTPDGISYMTLIPYLGMVMRDEGMDAARAMLNGVQESVLEQGIQLLAEGTDRETLVETLEKQADREIKRIKSKFKMVIDGLAAIQEGQAPREVGHHLAKM